LQKSVARAARERTLQALRYLRVERKGVVLLCQREVSMRSQNGSEQHRIHTQNLAATTALRQKLTAHEYQRRRQSDAHSAAELGLEEERGQPVEHGLY
jgi:hypothetical protein